MFHFCHHFPSVGSTKFCILIVIFSFLNTSIGLELNLWVFFSLRPPFVSFNCYLCYLLFWLGCDARFKSKNSLDLHLRRHSQMGDKKKKQPKAVLFYCPHEDCSQKFSTKAQLRGHIDSNGHLLLSTDPHSSSSSHHHPSGEKENHSAVYLLLMSIEDNQHFSRDCYEQLLPLLLCSWFINAHLGNARGHWLMPQSVLIIGNPPHSLSPVADWIHIRFQTNLTTLLAK